jgi:hypothetical protein
MLHNEEFDPSRGHTFRAQYDFLQTCKSSGFGGAFARLMLSQTFKVLETLKVFGLWHKKNGPFQPVFL